jgi:hypothetical protein
MDERGRRRRWLAAVAILAITGGVGWLLALADACGDGLCGRVDLPFVVASLAWVAAAIIAIGLVLTRSPRPAATDPLSGVAPANRSTILEGATGGPEARVRALLAAVDRTPIETIRTLAVRPLDPDAHAAARARAVEAAGAGSRARLVEEGREAIVGWIDRVVGTSSYDPTFAGLAWRHEPLRVDDRVLLAATLEDAVLAVVAADLVDPATVDELLGPCAALLNDGRGPASVDGPATT